MQQTEYTEEEAAAFKAKRNAQGKFTKKFKKLVPNMTNLVEEAYNNVLKFWDNDQIKQRWQHNLLICVESQLYVGNNRYQKDFHDAFKAGTKTEPELRDFIHQFKPGTASDKSGDELNDWYKRMVYEAQSPKVSKALERDVQVTSDKLILLFQS
jgi:hypothetical protein